VDVNRRAQSAPGSLLALRRRHDRAWCELESAGPWSRRSAKRSISSRELGVATIAGSLVIAGAERAGSPTSPGARNFDSGRKGDRGDQISPGLRRRVVFGKRISIPGRSSR
jgi:hypothetical protein